MHPVAADDAPVLTLFEDAHVVLCAHGVQGADARPKQGVGLAWAPILIARQPSATHRAAQRLYAPPVTLDLPQEDKDIEGDNHVAEVRPLRHEIEVAVGAPTVDVDVSWWWMRRRPM